MCDVCQFHSEYVPMSYEWSGMQLQKSLACFVLRSPGQLLSEDQDPLQHATGFMRTLHLHTGTYSCTETLVSGPMAHSQKKCYTNIWPRYELLTKLYVGHRLWVYNVGCPTQPRICLEEKSRIFLNFPSLHASLSGTQFHATEWWPRLFSESVCKL